jgi:hypothetical protein
MSISRPNPQSLAYSLAIRIHQASRDNARPSDLDWPQPRIHDKKCIPSQHYYSWSHLHDIRAAHQCQQMNVQLSLSLSLV